MTGNSFLSFVLRFRLIIVVTERLWTVFDLRFRLTITIPKKIFERRYPELKAKNIIKFSFLKLVFLFVRCVKPRCGSSYAIPCGNFVLYANDVGSLKLIFPTRYMMALDAIVLIRKSLMWSIFLCKCKYYYHLANISVLFKWR